MPVVRVDLSDKELDAVSEFARLCGESIPSLMRKVVIRDATLADGYGADDPSYEFRIEIPAGNPPSFYRKTVEYSCNSVRRILGWREIHL